MFSDVVVTNAFDIYGRHDLTELDWVYNYLDFNEGIFSTRNEVGMTIGWINWMREVNA
jgi:hypothetical protein